MAQKYDLIVIGGGIVGLATAYHAALQKPNWRILLIEKEHQIAQHQTGHNSGVIHSGLYYKPGSLKATNCIDGYHKLLAFCDQEEINYEICGKIVLATNKEEAEILEGLHQRGIKNGLEDLKWIQKEEIETYEPHAKGLAALHVPQTGIINYTDVAQRLAIKFQEYDNQILLGQRVDAMHEKNDFVTISTAKQNFSASYVVCCAGLYSDKLIEQVNSTFRAKIIPFRGEYYVLKKEKEHLVKNLIYPVPDPAFPFLGVHFTRMIGGGVEAGPNAVLAFAREGYSKGDINLSEFAETIFFRGFQRIAWKYAATGLGEMYRSFSKKAFAKALQKMLPEIRQEDLMPGGSGVRAQACLPNGQLIDDFLMETTKRCIHVCNAPSPAATSSLSIGGTIANQLLNKIS